MQMLNDYLEKLKETRTPLNSLIENKPANKTLFFKLFECQRCGYCCTELSDIYVSKREIKIIRKYIKSTFYVEEENGKYYIPKPCIFYNYKCTIYEVRPMVCRNYPLVTNSEFLQISTSCKGTENICKMLLQKRLKSQAL
jgi:Fe-S-cluster containining protein